MQAVVVRRGLQGGVDDEESRIERRARGWPVTAQLMGPGRIQRAREKEILPLEGINASRRDNSQEVIVLPFPEQEVRALSGRRSELAEFRLLGHAVQRGP